MLYPYLRLGNPTILLLNVAEDFVYVEVTMNKLSVFKRRMTQLGDAGK